jgi:hypothetical protein
MSTMYTIDFFQNWAKYGTWDVLKAWLTSEEGGVLRVVDPHESPFALIRYMKGTSNFALSHVPWCRSVVIDKATLRPVSVAPPRASPWKEDALDSVQVAEEFLDGTMINVFRPSMDSSTWMSTRSRIGGIGKFYQSGITFDEMMMETLKVKGIADLSELLPKNVPCGVTASFTSTVLQHPANRIVKTVTEPTYHMIHHGWVDETGLVTIHEIQDSSRIMSLAAIRGSKTIEQWINLQAQQRGFGWQGVVLKDGQGKRYRFRSHVYEMVRRIRGNETTLEERFARLRKMHQTSQYTVFYPEERQELFKLETQLRKNTHQLSIFYDAVFRGHTMFYHQLPWPYKHHVSVLHNLYKDKLRAEGKKITLEEVVRYVNEDLIVEDLANMSKVHNTALREAVAKPATEAVAKPATEAVAKLTAEVSTA